MNLNAHVTINPPDTGFISTSHSIESANDFALDIGADHVYRMNAEGFDVNRIFGERSPFPHENEIAVAGPISGSAIEGAWGPSGWIANPGFMG